MRLEMMWVAAVLAAALAGACKTSAEEELQAIADDLCACRERGCTAPIEERLMAWGGRNAKRKLLRAEQASLARAEACYKALVASAPAPRVDPAPPVPPVPPAPEPAPVPPVPEPAPVALVNAAPAAAQAPVPPAAVAKLDAMVARLQAMRDEIRDLDCKAAARAVTRYWKGFVPVKQVIRAANPDSDPDREAWLVRTYARPAFAAIGAALVDKGMSGCDEVDAWNRAVEATDFMGSKGKRR